MSAEPMLPQVQPREDLCCYPLNNRSLANFLIKVSDMAVGGIMTLNMLAVTYFLAWGKPFKEEKKDDQDQKQQPSVCLMPDPPTLWLKIAILGLPFAIYPLTVWLSGMAKTAERDLRGLGRISALVLGEFIWVVVLGGVMISCMSEQKHPGWTFLIVTPLLVVGLGLSWGYKFSHPSWLRAISFWCLCCCKKRKELHEAAAAEVAEDEMVYCQAMTEMRRAQIAFLAKVKAEDDHTSARERWMKAQSDADEAKVAADASVSAREEACAAHREALAVYQRASTAYQHAEHQARIEDEARRSAGEREQSAEGALNSAKSALNLAESAVKSAEIALNSATDALAIAEERVVQALDIAKAKGGEVETALADVETALADVAKADAAVRVRAQAAADAREMAQF